MYEVSCNTEHIIITFYFVIEMIFCENEKTLHQFDFKIGIGDFAQIILRFYVISTVMFGVFCFFFYHMCFYNSIKQKHWPVFVSLFDCFVFVSLRK